MPGILTQEKVPCPNNWKGPRCGRCCCVFEDQQETVGSEGEEGREDSGYKSSILENDVLAS